MTVTQSVEQEGKGNASLPYEGEPHRDADARARDARARESVTPSDAEVGEDIVGLWVDEGKDTGRKLVEWLRRDTGVLAEHPSALRDLIFYWWNAPMAGGSDVWRFLQRLDGFTLGLLFTLTGYSWAWLGQRPLRRNTFLLFLLIIWRLH